MSIAEESREPSVDECILFIHRYLQTSQKDAIFAVATVAALSGYLSNFKEVRGCLMLASDGLSDDAIRNMYRELKSRVRI